MTVNEPMLEDRGVPGHDRMSGAAPADRRHVEVRADHIRAVGFDAGGDDVHQLRVDDVKRNTPLRSAGVHMEHVKALAGLVVPWPPILVDAASMRVIDGLHRLLAAKQRGDEFIAAHLFHGSEEAAFIEAVRRNVTHGLPLTIGERERAAKRVLRTQPEWSDRRVAAVCGLSAKTVAALRARSTDDDRQLSGRVGRDGRVRPIDPVAVREEIVRVLEENPKASLRQVAWQVGTSQATVLDVRQRLERDENPIPDGLLRGRKDSGDPRIPAHHPAAGAPTSAPRTTATAVPTAPPQLSVVPSVEPRSEGRWTTDSACSATVETLDFAAWFERHHVTEEECKAYVDSIPLSRVYLVIDEVLARSRAWNAFANALRSRVERGNR